MAAKQMNRKVRYTRMVLREALLELMAEKPLEKITVTEICRLADVNRGTFYLHFLDVRDLLNSIEGELYESVREAFAQASSGADASRDLLLKMLHVMKEHGVVWVRIAEQPGGADFIAKCVSLGRQSAFGGLVEQTGITSPDREYVFTFMTAGAGAVIKQWVNGGFKEEPEELASILDQFVPHSAG